MEILVESAGATAAPGANVVLRANSGAPTWSNVPTLTGTNFTGIPGSGLTTLNTIVAGAGTVPSTNGGTGADLSAGASGGIPYFSSIGTMSASNLLTLDGVLYGGGAAGAPAATALSGACAWEDELSTGSSGAAA